MAEPNAARVSGGHTMNLNRVTANRPRALLVGIAAGLLLGLGAVQGAIAINEAANPGREGAPASESEKGGVPNLGASASALGNRAVV